MIAQTCWRARSAAMISWRAGEQFPVMVAAALRKIVADKLI
jgi:hypothetical protein